MSDYTDVMIDLETLGTVPGCAIVSIGAVAFNEFEVEQDGFYMVVKIDNWNTLGLTIDGLWKDIDTIDWWRKQSDEARAVFEHPHRASLHACLRFLGGYIASYGSPRVWGNGADFDNPIIAVAADKVGIDPKKLWEPYNGRCYRTVKNQYKDVKLVRTGTHHNALDDARSQAQHLVDICRQRGWRLA